MLVFDYFKVLKMNVLSRTVFTLVRPHASCSEIKCLLNKVKFIRKVAIKKYSYLSYNSPLLLINVNKPYENTCRCLHDNDGNIEGSIDEVDDITDCLPYDEILQYQSIRSLLCPDSEDPLMIKLNNCASIQEVLNFINENHIEMQHEHIAQAVLVLWDLQKMFFFAHQSNRTLPNSAVFNTDIGIQNYMTQLTSHPEFHKLLEMIRANCEEFDNEAASCVLLYLNKMGLSVKHDLLQLLASGLGEALKTGISLSALSRFTVAIFSEHNLGSFFLMQDALPLIAKELEKCETAEDLKLITISLNHLHLIVTSDLLEQYKDKVKELVDKNVLSSKNYRTVLKVIMLLSYPQWSDSNTIFISEMMMLLKNHLHILGVFDFIIAYEVLYKNHEPGELLTEMQRCAARLLLHLEEEFNLPMEIKVKLLSCTFCFSSPRHRPEYAKTMAKYIKQPLTKSLIFDLLRILTFIKPDSKVCEAFWDNVLETIQTSEIFRDSNMLLKLSQKYMNYSSDVHYRHHKFEAYMIEWFRKDLENGIMHLIPSRFSMMTAFVLAYGKDEKMINHIVQKLAENWEQFNHADSLYIAKGLRTIADVTINPIITTSQLSMVNHALNKSISKKLISTGDSTKTNFLLKSCIYRKHFDKDLIERLLLNFKADQKLSSTSIRNIIFSLQSTNGLLPDVIDNIAEYVINCRDHLLGFNAEKIAYLCYFLGYVPKKSDQLFQAIANVIIRDQERISGLSYIQAAHCLCFFNKVPDSFIKQIFNVAFLEKLDAELATCYFKDVYPIRVRHSMMQLNRAVCLDYPQSNIPWFHQKYIEQLRNRVPRERHKDIEGVSKIKDYLLKIVGNPDYLLQDANTAYGYHVDFTISLASNGQLIKPDETEGATRVAILLMKPNAYTKINVQLKGQYQLKKRHLEILGYKVLTVDVNEWSSLVYGEEKLEYFTKLIWPDSTTSQAYSVTKR